jgi:hypothetical protein
MFVSEYVLIISLAVCGPFEYIKVEFQKSDLISNVMIPVDDCQEAWGVILFKIHYLTAFSFRFSPNTRMDSPVDSVIDRTILERTVNSIAIWVSVGSLNHQKN